MSSAIGATAHGDVTHLLPLTYKRLVSSWLEEDCPNFDYGGFVVGEDLAEAKLLGKSPGILAGVPFFNEVFHQLSCTIEWHHPEGATIVPITHMATIRGPTRNLLLGERVALNTLARCSGIATATVSLLSLLRSAGYRNTLAATRKTTPGFRLVEKYGVLVGGADPHRHDLSAMVMLKDNHIWACGGDIRRAVEAARAAAGFAIKIEVECQSEKEAQQAVDAGADVVMLDNFEPGEELAATARRLKDRFQAAGRSVLIEVSGGLTQENVKGYVCEDVDVISTSSIHQGVKHVDFSLKVMPKKGKAAIAAEVVAEGDGEAKDGGEDVAAV